MKPREATLEPERRQDRRADAPTVPMYAVVSSAIDAIGYDPIDWILYIRFRHTGLYTYRNVPPDVFLAFFRAASKGQFYNRYIRNTYRYARWTETDQ